MKSYPSIRFDADFSLRYHIFDKLDGSNIRAEWTPARGFYKFGSRTQLLTPDQANLWPCVAVIERLSDRLGAEFKKLKTERAVCFFEWAGPNSFAGSHHDDISFMDAFLLDIAVYKKGLMAPDRVLEIAAASGVSTPALLHQGKIDQEFLDRVKTGQLPGMTFEGIVGKGPFVQKEGGPVMFKHKSGAGLEKLRTVCAGDETLFRRLA